MLCPVSPLCLCHIPAKKQQTNELKILHDFNIYSEYIRVIKLCDFQVLKKVLHFVTVKISAVHRQNFLLASLVLAAIQHITALPSSIIFDICGPVYRCTIALNIH